MSGRIDLVLSLFPGIGLLDMAFEEEGFCVVRGPDLLWGGDIRRFHPPAGVFGGVIGGPPCQAFSRLNNIPSIGARPKINLIPEFERCVAQAEPTWFLMENIPEAPLPIVIGYMVQAVLFRDHWVGGETMRQRRFSFGTRDGQPLAIEYLVLHRPNPLPAVTAAGGSLCPVRLGGSGKIKRRKGTNRRADWNDKTEAYFAQATQVMGLSAGWDLPGLKVKEKIRALGNGVPLAMGRAVARAVRTALERPAAG